MSINERRRTNTPGIQRNKGHEIDSRIPDSQLKRAHTAKRSKLAPFRQPERNPIIRPDNALRPHAQGRAQKNKNYVAAIDGEEIEEIPNDSRPPTFSAPRPQLDRSRVLSGNSNTAQQLPHLPPLAPPSNNQVDNIFQTLDQLLQPHTQAEDPSAALIQQHESQQRPREYVVPELKWGYTIKYVDSADLILDDEDRAEKATTDRSFADRARANEYLDKKTSPDAVGGLEAVVRRTTTLEGPERLLKVDIELSNGEHHLMWVERSTVVLRDLRHERRRQTQWQATPRPKLPHYVVSCDLLNYDAKVVTRSDDDSGGDDGDDDEMDLDGERGSSGAGFEVRIEKRALATFTIREMANKHAGETFLEQTKVVGQFREPSDDHWWRCNALPEHKRAEDASRAPDGLYEATIKAYGMRAQLGWDQILVYVREVDDVDGPVNF